MLTFLLFVAITLVVSVGPLRSFMRSYRQRMRRTPTSHRWALRATASLVKFFRIIAPVGVLATSLFLSARELGIILAIAGAVVTYEFGVRVVLPVYRAAHFCLCGFASGWDEAWEVAKNRRLQPQSQGEFLSLLSNQRRVDRCTATGSSRA